MEPGHTKLNGSPLISDTYRHQQEHLHETTNYGVASIAYAPLVSQIIERMQVSHLLDYGCGARANLFGHLKVKSKVTYQAYDPGVPRFSQAPVPAELVCCIDVLEHIEPDYLDNVLDDLARLTEGVCFLTITTTAAVKVLDDGRNAHLTQQPMAWWVPKLFERFDIQTVQVTSEDSFYVIGLAKAHIEAGDGTKLI